MENNPRFRFSVKTANDDYIKFNEFMALRSPYNKYFRVTTRISVPVFVFIYFLFLAMREGLTSYTAGLAVAYVIFTVLYEISLPRSMKRNIRRSIKKMEKSGKLLYSAESEFEFYDDSFTETTAESKSEYKYTAIDRISIVGETVMYVHFNNTISFIIPVSSIGSEEEKIAFVSFLREKCEKIDIYK